MLIEHDFTTGVERITIRQPGEPLPEPQHPDPGSPQVTEGAAVARMASALRDMPADHLSIDWRRNWAYIDYVDPVTGAKLTDAEIEAPGHDKAALRSEYIRRNGMIALDSCAIAAGRGARDALRCVPPAACPYDDPVLASEWRRGYRDTVTIVGDWPLVREAPALAAE